MNEGEALGLNAWEQKCLDQMDDETVWARLHRQKPDVAEPLPKDVVRLIFRFNLAIFVVFLTLVLAAMAGFSGLFGELRDPWTLAGVVAAILGLAYGTALYVTALYRRSWNRRARAIREE